MVRHEGGMSSGRCWWRHRWESGKDDCWGSTDVMARGGVEGLVYFEVAAGLVVSWSAILVSVGKG